MYTVDQKIGMFYKFVTPVYGDTEKRFICQTVQFFNFHQKYDWCLVYHCI